MVFAGSLVEPAFAVTLNLAQTPETIYAYPTAFGTIDPIAMGDCLEGLTAEDAHGDAIPGQAASWTISPDGLVYTFTLREGIAWSDGEAVTARDFLVAFQWLFDPVNALDYAYLQFPIRNAEAIAAGMLAMDQLGVAVVDDKTLEITLEAPTPYFLQTLTHSTAYPLPAAKLAEFGTDWLKPENTLCNGPFVLVEQVPGKHAAAVKSETYYGRADIAIDRVNYLTVTDIAAGLAQFKAGEIDMFYDLPVSANDWIDANAAAQSHVAPFLGVHYYALNLDKPPFDNPDVRRALSMAIDRSMIDPQGVHSDRVPAYGLVPQDTANAAGTAYRPDWVEWPYERRVAEAAAIMAQLGYTAKTPLGVTIRYANSPSDAYQDIALDVAAMWSAIGVKADLFGGDLPSHYEAMRTGDFDISHTGWLLDFSDPSNMLDVMTGSSEFNAPGYDDPQYEALLQAAATETDLVKRAGILRAAEQRVVESAAVIPLNWIVVRNLIAPGISGIVDNAKNVHRSRWVRKAS